MSHLLAGIKVSCGTCQMLNHVVENVPDGDLDLSFSGRGKKVEMQSREESPSWSVMGTKRKRAEVESYPHKAPSQVCRMNDSEDMQTAARPGAALHLNDLPPKSHQMVKHLTKPLILEWTNELKAIHYLLGCAKFNEQTQKRLDVILSVLEDNRDHPHLTKKLLQESKLYMMLHQVLGKEYFKDSRRRAKKIHAFWEHKFMLEA